MTSFEIERLRFSPAEVAVRARLDRRLANWPVVYTLNNSNSIYVGETLNVAARMRQHAESPERQQLSVLRVVLDETFNKSACLDLESHLIRWFAGDGRYLVQNRNDGVIDADYFDRPHYRETFRAIFEELRAEGLFERSIPEIENSDLFKLSPFKALSPEQAVVIDAIMERVLGDARGAIHEPIVVQGDPGTGKTIVAIYLMKLIRDIATSRQSDELDADSMFAELFTDANRAAVKDFRIGLVVPQQSLRASIQSVFRQTPLLERAMVVSPFDVGSADEPYDLLIVDETHRLGQRANQASGPLNKKFVQINERLFGYDDPHWTQLDWIRAQSAHQIFLIDSAQSVRPADLSPTTQQELVSTARAHARHFLLSSQMRVRSDADYVGYVRAMLSERPPAPQAFDDYDFRMFDNLREMRDAIREREADSGLARLVAGYAWPWKSKKDPAEFDIELDGCRFQWNSTAKDWINSRGALDEVGSIHTVQGYDLNYAGVIIGPDLRFDERRRRLVVDRDSYFDTKGKENNPQLGITYGDDDLLEFITNIYAVLLTRGMRGTYVYVCEPALRRYLSTYVRG